VLLLQGEMKALQRLNTAYFLSGSSMQDTWCTPACSLCAALVLSQDEMKALQRLNTAYFLSGYLGFTATWLLGLISRILGKQGLAQATAQLKGLLRCVSPQYCFAQGLYDITSTYQGSGELHVQHGYTYQSPLMLCKILVDVRHDKRLMIGC
jgi:hypothetical protein